MSRENAPGDRARVAKGERKCSDLELPNANRGGSLGVDKNWEPPEGLAAKVDKELNADRAFFRRWPNRRHRVRRIFPNERASMEGYARAEGNQFCPLPDQTWAIFVGVMKVSDTARCRIFFPMPELMEADLLSEQEAKDIIEARTGEQAAELVASFKKTFGSEQ